MAGQQRMRARAARMPRAYRAVAHARTSALRAAHRTHCCYPRALAQIRLRASPSWRRLRRNIGARIRNGAPVRARRARARAWLHT